MKLSNLDISFHMKNHYKKILNAKPVVDSHGNNSLHPHSISAKNISKTIIQALQHIHYPYHGLRLRKHDCTPAGRPSTRRNPADMPDYSQSPTKHEYDKDCLDCKDYAHFHHTGQYGHGPYVITDTQHIIGKPDDYGVHEQEYLQFALRITEDIIKNDLYTNSEMVRVFNSHIEANRGRLNLDRMLTQIKDLAVELNLSYDDVLMDIGQIEKRERVQCQQDCQCPKVADECPNTLVQCPSINVAAECACGSINCQNLDNCNETKDVSVGSFIIKDVSIDSEKTPHDNSLDSQSENPKDKKKHKKDKHKKYRDKSPKKKGNKESSVKTTKSSHSGKSRSKSPNKISMPKGVQKNKRTARSKSMSSAQRSKSAKSDVEKSKTEPSSGATTPTDTTAKTKTNPDSATTSPSDASRPTTAKGRREPKVKISDDTLIARQNTKKRKKKKKDAKNTEAADDVITKISQKKIKSESEDEHKPKTPQNGTEQETEVNKDKEPEKKPSCCMMIEKSEVKASINKPDRRPENVVTCIPMNNMSCISKSVQNVPCMDQRMLAQPTQYIPCMDQKTLHKPMSNMPCMDHRLLSKPLQNMHNAMVHHQCRILNHIINQNLALDSCRIEAEVDAKDTQAHHTRCKTPTPHGSRSASPGVRSASPGVRSASPGVRSLSPRNRTTPPEHRLTPVDPNRPNRNECKTPPKSSKMITKATHTDSTQTCSCKDVERKTPDEYNQDFGGAYIMLPGPIYVPKQIVGYPPPVPPVFPITPAGLRTIQVTPAIESYGDNPELVETVDKKVSSTINGHINVIKTRSKAKTKTVAACTCLPRAPKPTCKLKSCSTIQEKIEHKDDLLLYDHYDSGIPESITKFFPTIGTQTSSSDLLAINKLMEARSSGRESIPRTSRTRGANIILSESLERTIQKSRSRRRGDSEYLGIGGTYIDEDGEVFDEYELDPSPGSIPSAKGPSLETKPSAPPVSSAHGSRIFPKPSAKVIVPQSLAENVLGKVDSKAVHELLEEDDDGDGSRIIELPRVEEGVVGNREDEVVVGAVSSDETIIDVPADDTGTILDGSFHEDKDADGNNSLQQSTGKSSDREETVEPSHGQTDRNEDDEDDDFMKKLDHKPQMSMTNSMEQRVKKVIEHEEKPVTDLVTIEEPKILEKPRRISWSREDQTVNTPIERPFVSVRPQRAHSEAAKFKHKMQEQIGDESVEEEEKIEEVDMHRRKL